MFGEPVIPSDFNPKTSPLAEAYELLDASNPLDLNLKYVEVEQVHFKDGTWDYDDETLLFNKVKNCIEVVGLENLRGEEEEWAREILWFWYHHAISYAFSKDRKQAQLFAERALQLQDENHPNQITRLLYYLVHNDVEGAESWWSVMNENEDKQVARELIDEYKNKF